MYLRYGVTGVRGEAQSGFRSVLMLSLPRLQAGTAGPASALMMRWWTPCCSCWLALGIRISLAGMIGRSCAMRSRLAQAIARGGMQTVAGREAVQAMDEDLSGAGSVRAAVPTLSL